MASLIPELWFFKIRTISGSKCSANRRLQKEEPTRHEASARNKAASRHSRRPERFRCVPGIHTPWKCFLRRCMQAALGRTGCFRRTVLCVTPGLYEHRINKMKKPLKLFFLIVPLLALCSAATAAQASLEDQLTAAEAKWKMKKPKTYEFSVKFCASCPQSGWGFTLDPIRFRVEDGE